MAERAVPPSVRDSRNVVIPDEAWAIAGTLSEMAERPRSWIITRLLSNAGATVECVDLAEATQVKDALDELGLR